MYEDEPPVFSEADIGLIRILERVARRSG